MSTGEPMTIPKHNTVKFTVSDVFKDSLNEQRWMMSKVLHIKDAYFKIPDKCKDDFGCAITLLGVVLQRSGVTLEEMNELYADMEVANFLEDDKQQRKYDNIC